MINAPDDLKAVEQSCAGDNLLGIVMLKNDAEHPGASDLHKVGTVARIVKKINLPDGGLNIFISTIKRFKIKRILSEREPMAAIVEYLEDVEDDTFEVKALTRALISEMKEISENNPLFSEEMRLNMINIDHPGGWSLKLCTKELTKRFTPQKQKEKTASALVTGHSTAQGFLQRGFESSFLEKQLDFLFFSDSFKIKVFNS